MKIIDLLNKIANGEEVPQKIKIGNKIYNYETFNIGKGDDYFTAEWEEVKGYRINYDGIYYYLEIRDYSLNDEVEIIKEDKEKNEIPNIKLDDMKNIGVKVGKAYRELFEGLNKGWNTPLEEEKKIPEKFKVHSFGDKDENGNFVSSPFPTDEEFMNKINEIIDYLKSKGE